MRIAILGAGGKTGLHLVRQAIERGYLVNALVRKREALAVAPNLNTFVGDATNARHVANVSAGATVLVSALGSGAAKSTLMSQAVRAVVEASAITGLRRIILLSSYAVR